MTDISNGWNQDFELFARKWAASQKGACMCLGNCEKCGYHRCHGCLCVFKSFIKQTREDAIREERGRILRAIENLSNAVVKTIHGNKEATIELRAKFTDDVRKIINPPTP